MSENVDALVEKTAEALANSKYAVALTGAGMSTESGIQDFRGPKGLWTKNPKAERDSYKAYPKFLEDPKAWWEDVLSNQGAALRGLEGSEPNAGHFALTELEQAGVLKWTMTQNIDALHEKSGSENILEYHGTVSKLRCLQCGARYPRESIDLQQLLADDQLPPCCTECSGALKSDVVWFGEPIPMDVAMQSEEEARKCDVMLVCGTSAVVYPFANLPRIAGQASSGLVSDLLSSSRKGSVATVIEINAEPTPLTQEGVSSFLIEGKTGEILPRITEAVKAKLGGKRN